MRFVVIENASIDSRPHYRFDAFSTVRTKTFENARIARINTRVYDAFRHHFHFDVF